MIDKPIFNFDDYDKNTVMICESIDEVVGFATFLHGLGKTFRSGTLYTNSVVQTTAIDFLTTNDTYGFCFQDGKYCEGSYCLSNGYSILYYRNFDWEESYKQILRAKVKQMLECRGE